MLSIQWDLIYKHTVHEHSGGKRLESGVVKRAERRVQIGVKYLPVLSQSTSPQYHKRADYEQSARKNNGFVQLVAQVSQG